MGLAAPELSWLALMPIAAALIGGRRLGTACAIGIVIGVVAMWGWGMVEPYPQSAPPGIVTVVAVLSLVGSAVFGAWIGRIYKAMTQTALDEQQARLELLTDALRASEFQYRTVLENVPVGVMQTSTEGEIVLANPALARIFGYDSVDELCASRVRAEDFYNDPGERQVLLAAIADRGEHQVEISAHDRFGNPLRIRIHARARRGPSDAFLGIEGIVEDITDEHRTHRQLEEREAHFRALVQHSSDVVVVVDQKERVTYVSPSLETMAGIAPEAVVGRTAFPLFHPEDRHAIRTILQVPTSTTTEFRLRHRDGHFLFAEGIATPMYEDPAVQGLVLNIRDVTDRKRAEAVLVHAKDQAEEVARLKSTFLANMSHEIRTPLTGILGFADILSDEVTDPQQREFVDLILKSGQRLLDTLNSVLDLAKLDAGRMELRTEPLGLAETVRETVRLLEPLASGKNLTLTAEIRDEEARAEVDRGAVDRVLTNLVGNAIKFTETGEVRVVVRGTTSHVCLDVIDTGVGIAAEFLPSLFEEFQQESSGAERTHEGSGLGLAITHQLVGRMGGEITVRSQKGKGSVFTVTFPRASATEAPREDRPPRVLLVDDNVQTCRMAARMIEATYRVETIHDAHGAQALAEQAASQGDPFDILLLDINLGTMDTGEDVMRRLRLVPPYSERPIIAFTAYALPGDRERFLSGGFDGYFSKPFTRETLLKALEAALNTPSVTPPGVMPEMIIRSSARSKQATPEPGNA